MNALRHEVDRYLPNHGNLPHALLNTLGLREAAIRRRAGARRRSFVFVISPGRSGSQFVARLLDATADAAAVHEPRPRMNGAFLRGLSEERLAATYARRRVKLVQLLTAVAALPQGHTYVETSHMFVKTFYDVVLDYFLEVKLVHLRRSVPRVMRSFAELGYFSDGSTHWRHWMHDPYESEPLLTPAVPRADADAFDRILAYLADIEARAAMVRQKYPETPMFAVDLEEIAAPPGARRLVEQLGLEWTDEVAATCGQNANTRRDRKAAVDRNVDLEYCRKRLARYVETARQRDLPVPDSFLD